MINLHASAASSCSAFLVKYTSKKIFTGTELHAIEQLSAAILAARIGPQGFQSLRRYNLDNLEHLKPEVILNAITPQQRQKVQEQVVSDVFEFFWSGRVLHAPVDKYVKTNFSSKNGYFQSIRYLVIGRDNAKDARVEITNFLQENLDSIMVNASVMSNPHS